MKINILPEIIFPSEHDDFFIKCRLEDVFDDTALGIIRSADINIINLECVLTNKEKSREKWGSHLKASVFNVNFLKLIPNLIVNISNNHILDYGIDGLKDTTDILGKNGIDYVGSSDKYEQKPFITKKNIGIYACCEHDSYSYNDSSFVSLLDMADVTGTIAKNKIQCDKIICLYHGGREFYPYPSPKLRKRLCQIADAGADVIVCQHNHCVSCEENYKSSDIIYGQGTLMWGNREEIKDNIKDLSMMNRGMIVTFFSDTSQVDKYFFTINGNRISNDHDGMIKTGYLDRSKEILKENFVEQKFEEYAIGNEELLEIFSDRYCYGGTLRSIKSAIKVLLGQRPQKRDILRLQNHLNCESNREVLDTLLEIKKRYNNALC